MPSMALSLLRAFLLGVLAGELAGPPFGRFVVSCGCLVVFGGLVAGAGKAIENLAMIFERFVVRVGPDLLGSKRGLCWSSNCFGRSVVDARNARFSPYSCYCYQILISTTILFEGTGKETATAPTSITIKTITRPTQPNPKRRIINILIHPLLIIPEPSNLLASPIS